MGLMGKANVSVKDLLTNKDIAVTFEGAEAGTLSISSAWHTLMDVQPSTPLTAPSNIILHAKIINVEGLPESGRAPYTLHITVGKDKNRAAQTKNSHAPSAKAAKPLAKQLETICLNLAEHKFTEDEIASIINVSAETVRLTIEKKDDPAAAKIEMAEAAKEMAATQPA